MKLHPFSILSLAFCGWCPLGSAQATPREYNQNDRTEATLLKQTGLVGGNAKAKSKAAMSRNATAAAKATFAYPISRHYFAQGSGRSLQGAISSGTLPGVGDDILIPNGSFSPNDNDPIFGTSVSMADDGSAIAIVGSVIVDTENDHYKSFVDVRDVTTGELIGDRVYTETNEYPAIMRALLSGDGKCLAVGAIHRPSETFSDLKSGVQVYALEEVPDTGLNQMVDGWGKVGNFIDAGIASDVPGQGLAISMSTDGFSIVVGSRNFEGGKGKIRAFDISANKDNWDKKSELVGSDEQFQGTSVAMDKDGEYIASGSTGYVGGADGHRKGSVVVYKKGGAKIGNTIVGEGEDDECGFSVSLGRRSATVLRIAIGAILNDPTKDLIDAGHVRVFEIDVDTETVWKQVGTDIDGQKGLELNFEENLYHIGDYFGFSLDMSHDGTRVVAGAPFYSDNRASGYYSGRAAVYVFPDNVDTANAETAISSDWEQFGDAIIGPEKTSSSGFSVAIARGGTNIIIGNGDNGDGAARSGNISVYLETQVSESPSAFPSVSSQPSSVPSLTPSSQPSSVPSQVPSLTPSLRPSSEPSLVPSSIPSSVPSQAPSSVPSMAPSVYSFRTFSIVSSYSKFASLDTTRDWCIKTQNITPDSPLKVRPCDTEVHKGRWYYEDKKIKLRRENEVSNEFCIKDEGRKLFLKNCQNVGSEFYFGDEDSNTIFVEKNGKKLYFGIDTFKIFSRVRLYNAGNRNSSSNSWSVRYEGPSNAPSESAN